MKPPLTESRDRITSRTDGSIKMRRLFAFLTLFIFSTVSKAAALPSDWQRDQSFDLQATGLVKISLPLETLDNARPDLEDLRLYGDDNNELPYLIERPVPAPKITRRADSFQVKLQSESTVITFDGLPQPIEAISLDTPADSFIKSVRIEASEDGNHWRSLAEGQPIFRQMGRAGPLRLTLPVGIWRRLRLTVDDKRTQPIPFTGASVYAAEQEPAPVEIVPATITERNETPGETRLTLNLGAANLDLAGIEFETPESLFTRQISLAEPRVTEDGIREELITQGGIYRVAVEGQPPAASTTVPVDRRIQFRELIVRIRNQDSPPLPITAVRFERRPVYLVFRAPHAGVHHLLTGNNQCAAPRYDLAALAGNLKNVPLTPCKPAQLLDNPNYRVPEALPEIQDGTALDVSGWSFRKAIKIKRPGPQQLELDLDVLSRANRDFGDIRIMHGERQLGYVIARTSLSRSLVPTVSPAPDRKTPDLARWQIKLPRASLPLNRLVCSSSTPLFDRQVSLYEEVADERGTPFRSSLGNARWIRTPELPARDLVMTLDTPPRSDSLFLETHNGDNSPLNLANIRLFYPAVRVLFKTQTDDGLFLYYGNSRVSAPHYDVSLVANRLVAADKAEASIAPEEILKKSWGESRPSTGKGNALLWGILAVVVVVLLAVISKLLPAAPKPKPGPSSP